MEGAGPCGLEPEGAIFTWNGILLHAKSRHVEAVDHVLGRERNLDGRVLRHMQFVDLAPPFRMLNFPHPLLAYDVHVLSALWGRLTIHVHLRTPDEHHEGNEEWHRRPKQF